MKLFVIDPAVVNMGLVFYDSENPKKILFWELLKVKEKIKDFQQTKAIDYLNDLFFKPEAKFRKYIDQADKILIEIQMKSKMLQIMQIFGAYFLGTGKPYEFIHAKSVNCHFKIGKMYRPEIKGKTKKQLTKIHYDLNKDDGKELIKKRFPSVYRDISLKHPNKQDDVCDAIKFAVYYDEKFINPPPKVSKKRKATETKPKTTKKSKVDHQN